MAETTTSSTCGDTGQPNLPGAAVLGGGFCAFEFPVEVGSARSILSLPGGPWTKTDVLILERGAESVTLLQDLDGDSVPETKRTVASASGLNHGLALSNDGRWVYASSDTTVYRWKFNATDYYSGDGGAGQQQQEEEQAEIVVNNINADGQGGAPMGHWTRTLVFSPPATADDEQTTTWLYVSVGSAGNVDSDSHRSRIRRFDLGDGGSDGASSSSEPTFPLDFQEGEVFADGVRNEVGMAFDRRGVLWGVENGADRLARPDLGEDIFQDNPGEELHRFAEPNLHYGYPWCWTEYSLPAGVGKGRGSAWAWPDGDYFPGGVNPYTDADCANATKFARAELAMQGHSAPLGIVFYDHHGDDASRPEGCSGGFPAGMDGFAFIAFHGSWNRDVPTGYKVVYVAIDPETGRAVGDGPVDLLAHEPPNARWDDGFRPVDVAFDACGRLVVTSDGTRGGGGAKVVRIEYHGDGNFIHGKFFDGSSESESAAVSASPAPSLSSSAPTEGKATVAPSMGSSAPPVAATATVVATADTVTADPTLIQTRSPVPTDTVTDTATAVPQQLAERSSAFGSADAFGPASSFAPWLTFLLLLISWLMR